MLGAFDTAPEVARRAPRPGCFMHLLWLAIGCASLGPVSSSCQPLKSGSDRAQDAARGGAAVGNATSSGGSSQGNHDAGCPELAASADLHVDDRADSTTDGPPSIPYSVTRWTGTITVCFGPRSGKDTGFSPAQQDLIRRAVTDGWGRAARLHFSGFESCVPPPAESSRIVVQLDDTLPPGVLADTDWLGAPEPADRQTTVSFSRPDPSARTILHVFGHVLGFEHPRRVATCQNGSSSCDVEPADGMASPSIMSLEDCVASRVLTPWDIAAVQQAYSRHPAGTLVGMNAQCVDAPPAASSGTRAIVWGCHTAEYENQQWRMDGNGNLESLAFPSLVLDVFDASPVDGTPVSLFARHSPATANQSWRFDAVEIRGIGDLCLSWSSDVVAEPVLTIAVCTGLAGQKWNVEWVSTDLVRVHPASAPLSCVAAPELASERLEIATCSSDAKQRFTVTDRGELTYQGWCWSSEGGDIRAGRPMLLEPCQVDAGGGLHQQYLLHGNIVTQLGDLCLTTNTSDPREGDAIQIYACSGNPDFIWDYYLHP